MNTTAFRVDPSWLERLAMGSGRDEYLDGMQRHLMRVIDGKAQPIGPDEKAAYAEYQRMKAAIPSPAGLVGSTEDADLNAAAMVLMSIPNSIWSNQLYCFVYTFGIMRLINLWDVMQYLESKPDGVRIALANHDENGELLRSLKLIYPENKNAYDSIQASAKPPLEPEKRIEGTLKLKAKAVSRPVEVKDKRVRTALGSVSQTPSAPEMCTKPGALPKVARTAYVVPPKPNSEPPPISIDCFWLERLAMGEGRDEQLNDLQRYFLRVIDGHVKPIEADAATLAEYKRLKAALGPVSLAPSAPDIRTKPRALHKVVHTAHVVPSKPNFVLPSAVAVSQRPTPSTGTSPEPAPKRQEQPSRSEWSNGAQTTASGAFKSGMRGVGDVMDEMVGSKQSMGAAVTGATRQSGEAVNRWATQTKQGSKQARVAVGQAGDHAREVIDQTSKELAAQGHHTKAAVYEGVARVLTAGTEMLGKIVAGSVELAAMAVAEGGAQLAKHSEVVGEAASGVVVGTAGWVGGAVDSVGVTDADIAGARSNLLKARQACEMKRQAYVAALERRYPNKRKRLLEQATIGGLLLSQLMASQHVPAEIAAAYAAAYPRESMVMDFREKVDSLVSGDALEGLVSGVKGKLFEMQYVGELNAGGLPVGWEAELAPSATQPGWDIRILDDNGAVQEMISAKATEHVGYINVALHRYPDIDVVTTSEVYAAMSGTPEGARLIDGGLNHVDLHAATQDAVAGNAGGMDALMFSALALGPAAYAHFVKSNKSLNENVSGFTTQATRAQAAVLAGKAAMVVVPFWPVAFMAAAGLSMAASVGNNRREQLQRLEALRDQVRTVAKGHHEALTTLQATPRLALR